MASGAPTPRQDAQNNTLQPMAEETAIKREFEEFSDHSLPAKAGGPTEASAESVAAVSGIKENNQGHTLPQRTCSDQDPLESQKEQRSNTSNKIPDIQPSGTEIFGPTTPSSISTLDYITQTLVDLSSTKTGRLSVTIANPEFVHIENPASEEALLRRSIGGLGKFNTVPIRPLVPFLTASYVLAQRILSLSRSSTLFPMQKVHIARQVMHLVILLNDSVDREDGLSMSDEEEAMELEDELRELEKALKDLGIEDEAKLRGVLRDARRQFFRPRPYFKGSQGAETNSLWSRLEAYDIRALGLVGRHQPSETILLSHDLNLVCEDITTSILEWNSKETVVLPTDSIHTRRSTNSPILDNVLNDGDEIGPGLSILGQPINIVGTRTSHVPPMRVIRKLGAGSYAVVYLVQEIVSYFDDSFLHVHEDSPPATPAPVGRNFAVKCLARNAQDQEAQLLEATIHQSLPVHDNVVTLWHTLETASYLLFVFDYVPGEDLFYFLEQSRDYEPDETTPGPPTTQEPLALFPPEQLLSTQRLRLIASMFSQMCDAVAHCHRNRVFHRDIKPENFMVTDSRTFNPATGKHERKVSVKLTDFGLATRDIESGDMDCGSGPYMSFECNNNISPTYATAPADVWSLGVTLINMLYHANPWLTTAVGQCESFSHFLREPMPFFMHRFSGMTPAVAEFFARSVFCLLDNGANSTTYSTNTGRRITAERFGQWARDIHHHLGPSARRTPALAFQQLPNSRSVSSFRSPDEVLTRLMARSVSQPGTRTPSSSYRTRPPVPVHANAANYGTVDLESDSDSDNGEPMRTSSSKRRKRALRGKASPPFIQTDAALYAASILAAKAQEVAREIGAVDLTVTSSRVNTLTSNRSQPELRRKTSNKWTDIFKRDTGSDQELASTVDWATQDREDSRTSLSSPVEIRAAVVVKNIAGLLQALDPTPAPVVPSNDVMPWDVPNGPSSSLPSRSGQNEKRRDNNSQQAASPESLVSVFTSSDGIPNVTGRSAPSNDRRARSKSPTTAALEHYNLLQHTPPIPTVPESYHAPHTASTSAESSRKSYAPSIASFSTTTTSSSAFTAFSGKKTWRSSNASVRSVSTAATNVSSSSWRATSVYGQPVPALPSNIKQMDGIPKFLEELPNYNRRHSPNFNKKRQRPPSIPFSPAPGSSFGLDTITEKPKKSAMKQPPPSIGKSTAKNEVRGDIGSSFDLSGVSLSFGAAHGGKLLDLPPIKMDEANGNSLGDASGEQAQRLIQLPGAETVGEANADGSIIAATDTIRPPNSSRKNSWWRRI